MKVTTLSKSECEEFVVNKHYSRSPSIFWHGFALVISGMVEGVCVYGQPSPQLQKSAFKDKDFPFMELTRLVIQTDQKNAASFLVGNSLRMLPSPCAVVSYADTEHGHCGIVYQATNWIYTGGTKSHDCQYLLNGKKTHPMTLRDMGITSPAKWASENNIQKIKPQIKHRYFKFMGSKKQQAAMKSKLNYQIVDEYPKAPKTKYDDGEKIKMSACFL